MSTSKEPILWIQLLGIGTIPLEFLLLKLILAGSPLGPVPLLQRIIIAVIAIIIPTISLYKRPADWSSFLLFKLPLKGRSVCQYQISSLQLNTLPKLLFILGVIVITFFFWSVDDSAFILASISPLRNQPKITNILLSISLLSLIVWQWHQVVNSIWLLTRSQDDLNKATYITQEKLLTRQSCFGLDAKWMEQLKFNSSTSSTSVNINQTTKKD